MWLVSCSLRRRRWVERLRVLLRRESRLEVIALSDFVLELIALLLGRRLVVVHVLRHLVLVGVHRLRHGSGLRHLLHVVVVVPVVARVLTGSRHRLLVRLLHRDERRRSSVLGIEATHVLLLEVASLGHIGVGRILVILSLWRIVLIILVLLLRHVHLRVALARLLILVRICMLIVAVVSIVLIIALVLLITTVVRVVALLVVVSMVGTLVVVVVKTSAHVALFLISSPLDLLLLRLLRIIV